MKYARYPKYKDSGVEWLGEIPEGWVRSSVRYLFSIGRGRVISQEELIDDGLYPVYSSQTLNDGCLGYIETYDFDCPQITWTTDGANAGTVFIRDGKHNCTNVCGTLQPRSKNIHLRFYYYLLSVGTEFYKRPDTNGAKIMNNEMAVISIVIPSLPAQKAIATFLDTETAKLDGLIKDYEELIDLLQEKRQALISHAVTRGLSELVSPDDPEFGELAKPITFKDSGVEWTGEIPEGWEVTKLKYLSPKICVGIVVNPSDSISDDGLPFIYGGDIFEGKINFENSRRISIESSKKNKKTMLDIGDLLTIRVGAPGVTAVVPPECEGGNCASVMLVKHGEFNSHWLCYLFNTRIIRFQIEQVQYGAAQEQFNISDAVNFICIIPKKCEQDSIVSFLDKKIRKIDNLISETESAIELLKEHRSALITNAVTGKINVEGMGKTR